MTIAEMTKKDIYNICYIIKISIHLYILCSEHRRTGNSKNKQYQPGAQQKDKGKKEKLKQKSWAAQATGLNRPGRMQEGARSRLAGGGRSDSERRHQELLLLAESCRCPSVSIGTSSQVSKQD